MIEGMHPKVRELDGCPWPCHLIGSRYVGVSNDHSDYDYLLVASSDKPKRVDGTTDWGAEAPDRTVAAWLMNRGYEENGDCRGYGPDPRLRGIFRWTDPDKTLSPDQRLPPVDVLVATPKEAAMRLRFFEAQRRQGHERGGLLAKALKEHGSWPVLWRVLAAIEAGEACPPRVTQKAEAEDG